MRTIGNDARDVWERYAKTPGRQEKIIQAFCAGARFQLSQMQTDAHWKYVENFNREYARCKYHLEYSNTISPIVHEEVLRRIPGTRALIEEKV
jgi:hypothetical protein